MFRFQHAVVAAQNDGAFDDVLQFAHVAGPVMVLQERAWRLGETLDVDAVFAAETAHEFLGQKRHVLAALAQRRHVNRARR